MKFKNIGFLIVFSFLIFFFLLNRTNFTCFLSVKTRPNYIFIITILYLHFLQVTEAIKNVIIIHQKTLTLLGIY